MNSKSLQPVPYRVETPRLLLRCWSPADATTFREAVDQSDDHLRPWIPFMNDEPRSLPQTAQWLREVRSHFDRDIAYHYAVFDRASGRLLGGNMLNPRVGTGGLELGYWTRSGETGSGIASEATCAMIKAAFEIHRAERVEIHCSPRNEASAAIPGKLGFTLEATLKSRVRDTAGAPQDLMIWSLFAGQYPGTPASRLEALAFDCLGQPLEMALPSEGAGR